MDLWEIRCEVDGTVSGSCPMVDIGISSAVPSDSAKRETYVVHMDRGY